MSPPHEEAGGVDKCGMQCFECCIKCFGGILHCSAIKSVMHVIPCYWKSIDRDGQ